MYVYSMSGPNRTDTAHPIDGVRAGAKRLGRKDGRKKQITEPVKLPNGSWSHE